MNQPLTAEVLNYTVNPSEDNKPRVYNFLFQ